MSLRARPRSIRTRAPAQPRSSGCLPLIIIALGYTWLLLGLLLVHQLAPQSSGVLALSQILAPYLCLPLLLWIPLALHRGAWLLRLSLALGLLVSVVRFVPPLGRGPAEASANAPTVTVMAWNVWVANSQGENFHQYLLAQEADVIILQEYDWESLYGDTELEQRYPHQLVHPGERVPPGMALFSVHTIRDYGTLEKPAGIWDIPRVLWAELDLGQGQSLVVIAAHPIRPLMRGATCGTFCAAQRDQQIAAIDNLTASFTAQGYPVVLAGDLNLTEREPAYDRLTERLWDAHIQVGRGWGNTWKLGPLPLFRIDYLMGNAGLLPTSIAADCSAPGSDHCSLTGQFALNISREK